MDVGVSFLLRLARLLAVAYFVLLPACAPDPTRYLSRDEASQVEDLRARHANAAHDLGLSSFFQGREAVAKGELAQAVVYYERAALLLPHWDLPNVELGLLHPLYDNDARAATEALSHAVACNPQNPRTRLYMGQALSQLDRPQEAEAAYLEALRLKPDYNEVRLRLAGLYRLQKRQSDAIRVYEDILAGDGQNTSVWGILAGLYEETGRLAQAETAHRQLLVLQKDTAYAYFKYGLFLQRQKRLEDAKSAFERAYALSPQGQKRNHMRPLLPSKR